MAQLKRIWVTEKFRQFAFEEKAMRPEKPLHEVLDDIAEQARQRRGKRSEFPKFL